MGSVKDLVMDDSPAGKLYIPPEPHKLGQGAWKVSGRFSVANLKELIPDVEIPQKNFVLAMTAARYWENAASNGIRSCYLGMMDRDGWIVDTQALLDRGEVSDVIVMRLANVPKGHAEEDVRAYHEAIKNGEITAYVADAESIFRAGFPLGSSAFKRIFKLARRGEVYEQLSTYDETVTELDRIRADVKEQGYDAFPGLSKFLAEMGLDGIPNPGHVLAEPVYDFTTKFAIGGDKEITEQETMARMGLDEVGYAAWKAIVKSCARDQIEFCKQRSMHNIDGKVEGVVVTGEPRLTDFACTVDENRLMIEYEQNGVKYLIPSNKEIQRAIFRANGIYAAVDQAKEKYGDAWHDRMTEYVSQQKIRDVAVQSCEMMAEAIKAVGNMTLGRNAFDAKPVAEWVGPFLPYASRLQ